MVSPRHQPLRRYSVTRSGGLGRKLVLHCKPGSRARRTPLIPSLHGQYRNASQLTKGRPGSTAHSIVADFETSKAKGYDAIRAGRRNAAHVGFASAPGTGRGSNCGPWRTSRRSPPRGRPIRMTTRRATEVEHENYRAWDPRLGVPTRGSRPATSVWQTSPGVAACGGGEGVTIYSTATTTTDLAGMSRVSLSPTRRPPL